MQVFFEFKINRFLLLDSCQHNNDKNETNIDSATFEKNSINKNLLKYPITSSLTFYFVYLESIRRENGKVRNHAHTACKNLSKIFLFNKFFRDQFSDASWLAIKLKIMR